MIEQKHWRKNGTTWSDYQMFLKIMDPAASVTYVKVVKIPEAAEDVLPTLERLLNAT